ncbi:hypothetical protein X738_24755 [Mesorhizobium sp. LNHC209A00]|nr:hypothetical protein X738_24755 [Mesorhizobium sp. LNHC209A00]
MFQGCQLACDVGFKSARYIGILVTVNFVVAIVDSLDLLHDARC